MTLGPSSPWRLRRPETAYRSTPGISTSSTPPRSMSPSVMRRTGSRQQVSGSEYGDVMSQATGRDVAAGRPIQIHDPSLRDGHHAVRHNLGPDQLRAYARAADAASVPVVEVGHGNGLGASSLQVGRAR